MTMNVLTKDEALTDTNQKTSAPEGNFFLARNSKQGA